MYHTLYLPSHHPPLTPSSLTLSPLTKEVVRAEEVIVPDLEGEAWQEVFLCLCQTVEVFLGRRWVLHINNCNA